MNSECFEASFLIVKDGVARITVMARSCMGVQDESAQILKSQLQRLELEGEVRVLVLSIGAHPLDIGCGSDARDGQPGGDELEEIECLTRALEASRPITIARLNGALRGDAADLALACDFRISTLDCQVSLPAVGSGRSLRSSTLRRWTSRLGLQNVRRLALAGKVIDATTMETIGFVDHAVPESEIDLRIGGFVERLLSTPASALLEMKQALNAMSRCSDVP